MCEISKKISLRRKQLGLTLEDVGKAVGVGRSTVQRWESGLIRNMGRDKIAALARVLQINPVELVPGENRVTDIDQQRLEALHQNPRLGLLFDRSSKMKPEDVDVMIRFAEGILQKRDGGAE